MSMEQKLTDTLKTAMRNRDKQMLGLVRMLKSKMTETTTKSGFNREVDDELWLEVIEAYARSQQKALTQYEEIGDAGQEHIDQLKWELEALKTWLPTKADEETVKGWVAEAIDGLGGPEAANFGQVMGAVMKNHKKEVEPTMVRNLVQAALS